MDPLRKRGLNATTEYGEADLFSVTCVASGYELDHKQKTQRSGARLGMQAVKGVNLREKFVLWD
jgi:hypothetical protein